MFALVQHRMGIDKTGYTHKGRTPRVDKTGYTHKRVPVDKTGYTQKGPASMGVDKMGTEHEKVEPCVCSGPPNPADV